MWFTLLASGPDRRRRTRWWHGVVTRGLLPDGSVVGGPALFGEGRPGAARSSVLRDDHQQVIDRRSVVGRRRGDHRFVCVVWVGMRGDDQQHGRFAVDSEYFEGADCL